MALTDKIIIKDLEVNAHIGVTLEEQARSQRLLVTVELERDLAEAGRSDTESTTTGYEQLLTPFLRLSHFCCWPVSLGLGTVVVARPDGCAWVLFISNRQRWQSSRSCFGWPTHLPRSVSA